MKSINEYNSAILNLCEEFGDKYFEESDRHIIGNNNIWLWPLEVADYYFSIDEIVCALNNDIPKAVLLKWYDACLEDWKVKSNLYNYYLRNK
jgi:hypothetical protein